MQEADALRAPGGAKSVIAIKDNEDRAKELKVGVRAVFGWGKGVGRKRSLPKDGPSSAYCRLTPVFTACASKLAGALVPERMLWLAVALAGSVASSAVALCVRTLGSPNRAQEINHGGHRMTPALPGLSGEAGEGNRGRGTGGGEQGTGERCPLGGCAWQAHGPRRPQQAAYCRSPRDTCHPSCAMRQAAGAFIAYESYQAMAMPC